MHVVGEAEDCDDENELSSTALSKCCSEDLLLSSVNYESPLSLGAIAIDRIKRYCSVDIDTDFIANFNYDFLNDNII